MKNLAILLFISICYSAVGQTLELEKQSLSQQVRLKKITSEELKRKAVKLSQLTEELGGYPSLPYNQEKERFEYEFIYDTKTDKSTTFNRILEWSAIRFNDVEKALRYQNIETGKVVLKGVFEIIYREDVEGWFRTIESTTDINCNQTWIFTIKDNKLKIEVEQIAFQYRRSNLVNGVYQFNDKLVPIDYVYPIVRGDEKGWKGNLNMLRQTSNTIELYALGLRSYINEYESDYKF
jgi:hypothetical protein